MMMNANTCKGIIFSLTAVTILIIVIIASLTKYIFLLFIVFILGVSIYFVTVVDNQNTGLFEKMGASVSSIFNKVKYLIHKQQSAAAAAAPANVATATTSP